MTDVTTREVPVLGGRLTMHVDVAGDGPPVVFLHGAGGFQWDAFLRRLAERCTVHAPYFPGTHPAAPQAIGELTTLWDAVLAYDELLDALGLDPVPLIGHSFGGMLAAEVAAQRRQRISRLVLVAPIGLWRQDAPYSCASWTTLSAQELPGVLFHRLDAPEVQEFLTPPADEAAATEMAIQFMWTLGCTGKLIWPIPDKGLARRVHRITAPTLVVWGAEDALIPPVYADAFAEALPDARVERIPEAGHYPTLEQLERVSTLVRGHLEAA